MEVHLEIENDRALVTYGGAVKQFFDHSVQQPNNDNDKIPIELTNTAGTSLQDLNDDCLLEIFSLESLALMDLCSLAETCTRFKQITQRLFPKKFIVEADYNYDYPVSWWYKPENHLGEGRFSTHDALDIVKLVTEYCTDTLERLKITAKLSIPEVLTVKLEPIFQQLVILRIGLVTIEGGRNLFANCDSLIQLILYYVPNHDDILVNTFPKLERFSFYNNEYNPCSPRRLLNFMSRHRSLKTLNLHINIVRNRKCIILQAIHDNCKELEELSIDIEGNEEALYILPSFDKLKQLDIQVYGRLSTESVLSLKSLETLKIRTVYDDLELIPALSQLKNLRELHLPGCFGADNLKQLTSLTQLKKLYLSTHGVNVVDIIRQLTTNLEELTIDCWNFVLYKKMFSEIVEIVKGRPYVLALTCKFNFLYNLSNCDENRKVRLIKR